METESNSFLDGLSGAFFKALDYTIDDKLGAESLAPSGDVFGGWYPETTAPNEAPPTEAGFMIGNNTKSYAIGAAVLVSLFLLYKAVK